MATSVSHFLPCRRSQSSLETATLFGYVMFEDVPPRSHPPAALGSQLPRGKQARAAGAPQAALAQPAGMLLRPQAFLLRPREAIKLKGLLRICGMKEARGYHKYPKCCLSHQGPSALPEIHVAQSTHPQAALPMRLCSSTCWHPKRIPRLQGWLWSSSFQRLLALPLWPPSPWEGGRHPSRLAPATSPAGVTCVASCLLKERFPMQEVGFPQNPGQKLL